MIKLSRTESYSFMDKADFNLMDSTHERLATVARNKGKSGELSSQFYVTFERKLRLAFYIGGEEVEEILFDKKITLAENGEMKLAELKAEKNELEGGNIPMEFHGLNEILKKKISEYEDEKVMTLLKFGADKSLIHLTECEEVRMTRQWFGDDTVSDLGGDSEFCIYYQESGSICAFGAFNDDRGFYEAARYVAKYIEADGVQRFILDDVEYTIYGDHYIDEDRTNEGIKPVFRVAALSEYGDEVEFTFATVEGFELLEDAADHVADWENFIYVKNIEGEVIYHRHNESEFEELEKVNCGNTDKKIGVVEMENNDVNFISGINKGNLKGLAHRLDGVLGGLELIASNFENLDSELARLVDDIENTPEGDVNLLALQAINTRHLISLLSSHSTYLGKDLKKDVAELGAVSEEIFDIAVKASNDDE